MDFKQIEAFINVAKFKSFSKAATSCFLSQPAISSHIASLEKDLNVQLFDRTSKEVLLTPAGESFLKYALDILNTRDKAIYNIVNFNETINGKLKLAASTTPCNTIVPSLIKKFYKSYPEVSFDVIEQSSGEIIEDIIKFDCEIGLVGELVNDEKIKSYKLIEDDLVIISSPALNIADSVYIEDILNYKFILREEGSATRKTFEYALRKEGFDPSEIDVHFEVNNLDTLFQFVKSGLGISVVSKHVLRDYISLGLIKESKIENLFLKRYIYLITSSKRTLTPTAKAFFNLCKDHFDLK
ncbi:selenium metabolism-associated LysR family transcriptional regulator [Clostridium sp. CX1]|uniref:Selenium metabolism-associated LysR family transcriptional regulator n=1 Tax=Clostridium tanneri TaxID=3037988 RepID=A0ABU4JU19_9CLOT|nr:MULTISPECIES: selenium metabolism-associated LysR family transcriptional regulator [unclassified Clostridium]MCT8977560.1 selenium metabolism-associated LysR family transcriptional regulator [Clostridium sp. CX1]MDW8801601.1 selenium metabolism-associated LysR family transcriptional regulator [Clostridium sp. A1-XYC3]